MQLTQVLDKHYENYDFLFMENANFDYVKGKVDVFLNGENWLVVFQTIGVSKFGPETWINFYSDSYPDEHGFADVENIEVIGWDFEDEFPESRLYKGAVLLNGQQVSYSFTNQEYASKGIFIKDKDSYATYLLRCLAEKEKSSVFFYVPTHILLERLDEDSNWSLFYSTEEWEHTEIEDKPPSQNIFFSSLQKAVENKNTSLIQLGKPNTHWSNWTDYDFDQQGDWEIDAEEEFD